MEDVMTAPQPPSQWQPTSSPTTPPSSAQQKKLVRTILTVVGVVGALVVGFVVGSVATRASTTATTTTVTAEPTVDYAAVDKRQNDRTSTLDEREKVLNQRKDELDAREAALLPKEAAAAANTFGGEGLYVVGQDVNPGTYKTGGPDGSSCYYAIKNGTGADSDIIDNNIVDGPATVTLKAGQVFETSNCQDWTLR
jgi:hypothetical protein